jgi:hypothetical protein
MAGFSLFAQSRTAIDTAWRDIIPLIVGGSVKPIVERVYPLAEAGEALRHLTEDRPFGKVVLADDLSTEQRPDLRGYAHRHRQEFSGIQESR